MSAFFAAITGGQTALLLSCINTYKYARLAHGFCSMAAPLFPSGLNMGPRSMSWTVGILAQVCVAYAVLAP